MKNANLPEGFWTMVIAQAIVQRTARGVLQGM